MGTLYTRGGFISTLDSIRQFMINPPWSRKTDSIPVITSAETLTDTNADIGGEISCEGYRYAYIYMTISIVATDTDFRLAIMAKHESAGSEEMPLDDGLVTISGSTFTAPSTAAIPYFEETDDPVSADLLIKVDLNNCVAFLQIMAYLGTDTTNTSTIDTCDVILGY